MTGRNVNLNVEKGPTDVGAPRLAAVDLTVAGAAARPTVDRVSLSVRAGEIVGIAGVAGNGQSELVEALVGLRRPDGGRVEICGVDASAADVESHRAAGLAYVPEDRAAVGSALPASAADNLAMGFQRAAPLARGGLVNPEAMAERARALIRRYAIRIPSERVAVGTLSGGNLQKVVVARELSHEAPVLIAEQPTRGLDVGATQYIHQRLVAERDNGRAVLLVSAELGEILAPSDRCLSCSRDAFSPISAIRRPTKRPSASLWRGGPRRRHERPRAMDGVCAAPAPPARRARDVVLGADRRGARAPIRPQPAACLCRDRRGLAITR